MSVLLRHHQHQCGHVDSRKMIVWTNRPKSKPAFLGNQWNDNVPLISSVARNGKWKEMPRPALFAGDIGMFIIVRRSKKHTGTEIDGEKKVMGAGDGVMKIMATVGVRGNGDVGV